MTARKPGFHMDISRRKLFAAAGVGAVAAAPLMGARDTSAASAVSASADPEGPNPDEAPPVAGLHLQFGADASSEVTVSWHTLRPVRNARVVLGRLDGTLEQTVEARPASYKDAKAGRMVYAWHAKLGPLRAGTEYLYGALHDGATPEFGTFRTAPKGRAPFTFTSFGDQGTPTLGRKAASQAGRGGAGDPLRERQSRLAGGR